MLLVHSGNRIDLANRATPRFAADQVPMVRARVARLLDALRPFAVVSAAAAGADLIVLEEAIARGLGAHIVLPIAEDDFVEQSVADAGPEWSKSFRQVLDHVSTDPHSTVLRGDAPPDSDWYKAAHDQLLGRAEAVADGDVTVALTIRPPQGEAPPSVTDDFALRAERMGLLTLCIDPRAHSTSSVIVT